MISTTLTTITTLTMTTSLRYPGDHFVDDDVSEVRYLQEVRSTQLLCAWWRLGEELWKGRYRRAYMD